MTERIDMSALELTEHRRDVMVASVMLQCGHELTRRASGSSPILFLGMWARPTLAAAAILAAVCGTMLARAPENTVIPGAGISEALGVSTTTTALMAAHSTPTVSYLIASEETQ